MYLRLIQNFCVTAESHLGTALSVGWSVLDTKFDTKFQRKIEDKMDTITNAVTQLGVPTLVFILYGRFYIQWSV